MTSAGIEARSLGHGMVAAAALLLASCGGGSGSGGVAVVTAPVVANRAPVIMSASTVSVAENTAGTILQVAATDADGNALTYSLSGGADRARFVISAAGALAFATSPNYDLPTDADENNDYELQVGVSDGTATTTATLVVTVTNLREGIAVAQLSNAVGVPTSIAPNADNGFLVGNQAGGLYKVLADRDGQIDAVGSQVIAATPAADFATTGRYFVMYVDAAKVIHISHRYLVFNQRTGGELFYPDEVLAISAPGYAGGGWMGLDPDGRVIAALGDVDASSAAASRAQDPASVFGKIFRIDGYDPAVKGRAQTYNLTVLARGLRAPVAVVGYNGGYLVTDRGGAIADEISFAASFAGVPNFGWPFKEGTRTVAAGAPDGLIDPIMEYARSAAARVGRPIVGGAIGTGAVVALRDQYVFATTDGNVYTFPVSLIRAGTTLTASVIVRRTADFAPSAGSLQNISDLRGDDAGRLLVADPNQKLFQAVNRS